MSGIGSTSTSYVPGTNVAPVSFPGIASGIDYNSIIQKLTAMQLAPVTQLNQQIATLNAATTELIKINSMLASVQNALTAMSDPAIYSAFSATSSNTSIATAAGIPNTTATPGTYQITSTQLATATQVTGAASMGHTMLDVMPGTTANGTQVALADSWASVTPSNGTGTQGSITIDGVTVKYDVTQDSITAIFARINTAVQAVDPSFNIGFQAGTDTVKITSSNPIALGAVGDQGNLLQVLHLDQAQVNNAPGAASVTGTAGVGGINAAQEFSYTDSAGYATNGNYKTAVTAGTFTINGVQIAVASNQNLYDVIKNINQSAAGVVASYNSATGQITLTNKNTGPQSMVLGSSSDTSNFLSAAGLTTAAGAATTLGTQASVTVKTAGGATQTVYSNSNTVTTAIPGVALTLQSSSTQPFNVTVGQDSSSLVTAVNTFVSAYNAAISEINTATAAPVVASGQSGITGTPATTAVPGGVLWGNSDVSLVKDQLVNMVSSLNLTTGTTYNSLSTIGLTLTNSYTQLVANSSSTTGTTGAQNTQVTTKQSDGTDGQLQPLDVSKLQAAMAANPTAVQNLLSGAQGMVTQLGTYLTGVTGFATQVSSGLLGTAPTVSMIQAYENANSSQITSIQEQISLIQTNVNQYADQLRQEFVAAETQLAGYQSLQQQLGSFFKSA